MRDLLLNQSCEQIVSRLYGAILLCLILASPQSQLSCRVTLGQPTLEKGTPPGPLRNASTEHNTYGATGPYDEASQDNEVHESHEMVSFRADKENLISVKQSRLFGMKVQPKAPAGIQLPMVPVSVPKICAAPALLANDCMYEPRWYYSSEFRSCLPFQSGSECDSNGNNFPTRTVCEEICKTSAFVDMDVKSVNQWRCGAPRHDRDLCSPRRWPDTRFYYDETLNRCVAFRSRGCAAFNSFLSLEDCTFFCRQPDVVVERVPTIGCLLPKVRGFEVCFNGQARWYHNVRTHRCEWFIYSGCFGNWNNFLSYSDCQNVCQGEDYETDVCSLPPDPGTSFQYRTRYFYDGASRACRPMNYSGFGGNANNFFVPEDCEAECVKK